jgi:hypothetical protein
MYWFLGLGWDILQEGQLFSLPHPLYPLPLNPEQRIQCESQVEKDGIRHVQV